MLQSVDVGQTGKIYLVSKIKALIGAHPSLPIATTMLQSNLIASGYMTAVLEAPANGQPKNFDSWNGNGGSASIELLANWVGDFVRHNPVNLCYIDEQISETDDQNWKNGIGMHCRANVLYSQGSIIYRISGDTNQNTILKLIKSTFSFSFFCALVTDESFIPAKYESGSDLSKDDLSHISMRAVGLVTDAYDFEGLLICSERQRLSDLANPFLC